jgi:hypothetical protein
MGARHSPKQSGDLRVFLIKRVFQNRQGLTLQAFWPLHNGPEWQERQPSCLGYGLLRDDWIRSQLTRAWTEPRLHRTSLATDERIMRP